MLYKVFSYIFKSINKIGMHNITLDFEFLVLEGIHQFAKLVKLEKEIRRKLTKNKLVGRAN